MGLFTANNRVQTTVVPLRATRRAAIVASYTALRNEVEGVQHEALEIVLRMRTAARDRRRGGCFWVLVLGPRRLRHGDPSRAEYEQRVRIRLAGVTPPRLSRVRAAAAVAAANSGPIGTSGTFAIGGTWGDRRKGDASV